MNLKKNPIKMLHVKYVLKSAFHIEEWLLVDDI